jgi:hypothetical protein
LAHLADGATLDAPSWGDLEAKTTDSAVKPNRAVPVRATAVSGDGESICSAIRSKSRGTGAAIS